jgi:hypothetical protein
LDLVDFVVYKVAMMMSLEPYEHLVNAKDYYYYYYLVLV